MYTILLIIFLKYPSYNATVNTEQIGLYNSIDVCQQVANKIYVKKKLAPDDGSSLHTSVTAQCVQVKDKP